MKGKLSVRVKNRHIEFRFELERNVTILTGDSGTGKTKLVQMIRDYAELGKSSGVSLTCKRPCVVLYGPNWESVLSGTRESVVFVDESTSFLTSRDFARLMRESDNYYVLITREALPQIAYSMDAIKQIVKDGAKPKLRKIYNHISVKTVASFPYDVVIVEDSKAGYRFFRKAIGTNPALCVTSEGKSGILPLLREYKGKRALVIADAAAIGPEIHDLIHYRETSGNNIDFFLPESFEWLILKSNLFAGSATIRDILKSPVDFIESKEFFSWERYFTWLLTDSTKDRPNLQYSKTHLAPGYCSDTNIADILDGMNKK